jgi:hypothetical protein
MLQLISLKDLLQFAYQQEINISIESQWDLGYSVSILTGYNNCEIHSQITELQYNEVKAALYKLLNDYTGNKQTNEG